MSASNSLLIYQMRKKLMQMTASEVSRYKLFRDIVNENKRLSEKIAEFEALAESSSQ